MADPPASMATPRTAEVVASMRAGGIRLWLHFYNTEEEVDRAVALLDGV